MAAAGSVVWCFGIITQLALMIRARIGLWKLDKIGKEMESVIKDLEEIKNDEVS